MEKKIKLLTGLVIASIVVNVITYSSLNKKMDNLKLDNRNLQNEITDTKNDIQNSISTQISNALSEQENNIDTYDFSFNGIDITNKSVNSEFKFTLKSSENVDKIKVGVKTENSTEVLSDYAQTIDKINYTFAATLPYKDNYEYSIYAETRDGGMKKMNPSSIYNSLKSKFENRSVLNQGGIGSNREKTDYKFSITNNNFGYDEFEIKDIKVECTFEGEQVNGGNTIIKMPTELNSLEEYNNYSSNENYSMKSENSSEAGKELYNENLENDYETRYFAVTVKHEEFGIKVKGNPRYNFKIILTYNNGDVQELY